HDYAGCLHQDTLKSKSRLRANSGSSQMILHLMKALIKSWCVKQRSVGHFLLMPAGRGESLIITFILPSQLSIRFY
ncbi:hypothetical protein, partial [Citrobacter sp. wls758]